MLCCDCSVHLYSAALQPCTQERAPLLKLHEILNSHFLFCQRGDILPAALIMVTEHPECAPAWSRPEVLDLIGLWSKESVLAQLRASKRNLDIYKKISLNMLEKGYRRDVQQCHVKIEELKQVYQKTKEANSHSGSSLKTCRFYEELHAILGGDPTTVPPRSTDTSGESRMDEDEEEDKRGQVTGKFILPESQELFVTPEQPSWMQDSMSDRDTGESTSVYSAAFGSASITPTDCLSQIRRWKKNFGMTCSPR
ncbi:uncharacterized protein [Emydura macquarii macquarii]|uniref:uncharacterized protein n=1 Tax=Emydura macquarii macquarii TaxID=1129001 RepID=UPI003529EC33